MKMFRPIALSAVLGKILERFLIAEINIMDRNQFGFVKNSSCIDSLLKFKHDALKAFELDESLIAISLDFGGV